MSEPSSRIGTRPRLRSDARPLYVQAENALRDLRNSLGLNPGDRLPSEIELGKMLGVSRSTIREALRNLELTGEVRRVHGLGTIVADRGLEIVAGLEVLESLEHLAARQGWACGTVDIRFSGTELAPPVAAALDRDPGTPAVRLERVKTRDGDRVAFMESILPEDVISLVELNREFTGSIIDTLLRLGRPRLEYAITHIRVSPAAHDVARQLEVDEGLPLLVLEEICCNPDDAPFCFNLNWFLPRSVRLDLVRRPR